MKYTKSYLNVLKMKKQIWSKILSLIRIIINYILYLV